MGSLEAPSAAHRATHETAFFPAGTAEPWCAMEHQGSCRACTGALARKSQGTMTVGTTPKEARSAGERRTRPPAPGRWALRFISSMSSHIGMRCGCR